MPAPTLETLIDCVDDEDRPVGLVTRGEVLRLGAGFRTVHVFVLDSDGRLLVQRLAATRERHAGRFGSSVAAYLYAGEDYQTAAERRLGEELGLRTPLRARGKLRMLDEGSMKFVALYTARSDEAQIREPDHIAELVWRSLPDLDRDVREDPAAFTPTFLELYEYFRRPAGE
jgi:isopentenyl-diphosphate Delta-isomerase